VKLVHWGQIKKTMRKSLTLITAFALTQWMSAQSNYSIQSRIAVEGDGKWDLVTLDESSNRLFLSHGKQVQVLDLNTKKVIASIKDTKGVHGIAIATAEKKGYTSNGKDTSVTIFNLDTYAVIKKLKVSGINPDVILYDAFSHKVFCFNGKSKNITVIDAVSDQIVSTIALDGKPELAVSNEKGKIFLNIEDKSAVYVINTTTMTVDQKWPLAPGSEPTGLALDLQNNRLFAGCDNKMMVVMDAENGKVITNLPIGEGVDGVVFDPTLKRAYSSNGESGTITVVQEVDANNFKVLENIPTQKSAKTIAINTKTHKLYLPAAEFDAPKPTEDGKEAKAKIKPGSFVVLEVAPN